MMLSFDQLIEICWKYNRFLDNLLTLFAEKSHAQKQAIAILISFWLF